MLEEVLTWLGVAGAAAVAWGLYVFGESTPKKGRVQVEDPTPEE